MVLEKTLESPLDCKEIQPVHPKDQSWVFIGRTDDEAETPILWPPDGKSWLIRKDLILEKIEGRRRRGQQRMRWLDGITASMDMSLGGLRDWRWTGRPGMLQFMGLQRVGHDWVTELNWTHLMNDLVQCLSNHCKYLVMFVKGKTLVYKPVFKFRISWILNWTIKLNNITFLKDSI